MRRLSIGWIQAESGIWPLPLGTTLGLFFALQLSQTACTMARDHTPSSTHSLYRTRAKLWRWSGGKASWYFITLPATVAREIRLVDAGPRRAGFGMLRVEATIGGSTWQTSIFPAAKLKSYLLPVKATVRRAEKLMEGRLVNVQIVVRRAG